MGSDKVQFIKETSVKLLAACLIEDRIAWYKHPDYCSDDEGITKSIEIAECLWHKLEEKGYVESEQENKIPPLEEGIDPTWINGFKGCI
jgi:hypothetical protein